MTKSIEQRVSELEYRLDNLTTNCVTLVHKDGTPSGKLCVSEDGPQLVLLGPTGGVILHVDDNGPCVSLCDKAGAPKARLALQDRASSFALVGPDNRISFQVVSGESGTNLSIFDGKNLRVLLGSDNHGPKLQLRRQNNANSLDDSLVNISLSEKGPAISIFSTEEGPNIQMAIENDNAAILASNGPETGFIGMGFGGTGPGITLADRDANTRIEVQLINGQPDIRIRDRSGVTRVAIVYASSGPGFIMMDETERARAGVVSTPEGVRMYLMDETGNKIWQAPMASH